MRLACTIPAFVLDVELRSCHGGGRPIGFAQTVAF